MIVKDKIGVGAITCNRESFFEKCIKSIPGVDFLVVVNDGKPYSNSIYPSFIDKIIQHKKNLGVAKSKNDALKILLENSCEHIFLIEDDVTIKNIDIFNHYIQTARRSGIYHLNFAVHGNGNRDSYSNPVSRKIFCEKGTPILSLNKNLIGAFSYYHRKILEKFGLLDEKYFNAWEHVDHTYQIIKGGFHPPFWWFADAPQSYDYISDQDIDLSKSVIRRNKIRWKYSFYINTRYFKKKNGYTPFQIPDPSEDLVLTELEKIKNKYSNNRFEII